MQPHKTVLVVDDHPAMRAVIKSNLSRTGIETILEAENGNEALTLLKKHPVHCVISDWNMPGLNGLDLLLKIRSDHTLSHTLFMMVTAEADKEHIQHAISAGVDEFLVKPFTPASLCNKVGRMLSRGKHTPGQPGAEQPHHPASLTQKKKHTKETLLVIDDTPSNIDVITGLLKEQYRVLAATSGKKGLQLAQAEPAPSLILLDIMMPVMDGMEVCHHLKSDPETADIPIIFLTAKTEAEDITAGLDAGAVDYITKPVNSKVLKARVRTQLSLKRSRDELSHQIDILTENARLREDIERMTRHDLKSPLTAIINTSELLMENRWLGSEQLHEIDQIRVSAYDILGMIDRSLDLYRMETGQYQLNAKGIDLVPLCQRVIEAERLQARKHSTSIMFESPEKVLCHGEELLCLSMISNLLKNAVEASPEQEKVHVRLSQSAETVDVEIHNFGVIPEEIRATFFEKYTTFGKRSGTGIGTYSARMMAKTQGGDIEFTSSPEKGTTLKISLMPYPDD